MNIWRYVLLLISAGFACECSSSPSDTGPGNPSSSGGAAHGGGGSAGEASSSGGLSGSSSAGASASGANGVGGAGGTGQGAAGEVGVAGEGGASDASDIHCLGNSGVWSPDWLRIDTAANPSSNAPRAGVDQQGNVIAIWQQFVQGSVYQVWASRRPAQGTFDVPVAISDVDALASINEPILPELAVSGDGSAIAAWQQHDTYRVQTSHFAPSSGWAKPTYMDLNRGVSEQADSVQIAMDSSGNGIVVWVEYDNQSVGQPQYGAQVYARVYASGTGWGDPVRLSASGTPMPSTAYTTISAQGPSVAMGAAGDAVVAWGVLGPQAGIAAGGMQVIHYDAETKAWGSAEFLDVCSDCIGLATSQALPRAALAGNGDALVVWDRWQAPSVNSQIWASSRPASTGMWSTREAISASIPWVAAGAAANTAAAQRVTADATGNAIATWRVGDGVFANHFSGGAWQGVATLAPSAAGTAATDESSIAAPTAFDAAGALTVWGGSALNSARLDNSATAWAPAAPGNVQTEEPQIVIVPGSCGGPLAVFRGAGLGIYAAWQK